MATSDVIETLYNIEDKPIKLYAYQLKWVNDTSQFRIVNKSRQTGFSWICALEALTKAIFVPQSCILFVSVSQKGANRIMRYVRDAWISIKKELRNQVEIVSFTKEEIEFRNGSKIISLPNNPDAARGYPATDVYLDEFAFLEAPQKMWEAILPTISRKDMVRRLTIISTPNGKIGEYYRIYVLLEGKEGDVWSRHVVHYTDCPDLNVEKIRATMTEEQFRQEYNCEFIDEATSAIPFNLIYSCIPGHKENELELVPLTPVNSMPDNTIVYCGVDFGKKRDSTSAVYFEKVYLKGEEEPTYYMRKLTLLQGPYAEQIPLLRQDILGMKVINLQIDATGIGEKVNEDFIKYGINATPIIFTRSWKEQAFANLKILMQRGKVKFLNDEELINQLHDLEMKITPMGNVRYEHAHGKHDDIFWSICLALHLADSGDGFYGVIGGNSW